MSDFPIIRLTAEPAVASNALIMNEQKRRAERDTQDGGSMSASPLAGLTVVELGHSVAAPFAGQIFGDLGARVVKVEHPGKGDDARGWGPPFVDGVSACFLSLNRNKQSVAVDLRNDEQRARLRDFIVREADVVLQNLRPGAVERHGLDPASLRGLAPRLVYCNMGAFGRSGPFAQRPGYDPLMQAAGGIMSITGEPGRPPVRVGVSLVDMGTAMWAVIGVLSALRRRDATGEGSVIDVSLYETALGWMSVHAANFGASGEVPSPYGSGAPITAPYQAFRAKDGYLVIAAGNGDQYGRLCTALGHPEWRDDPRFATNPHRLANKAVLAALIEEVLAACGVTHWIELLEAHEVPCAPIHDIRQVVEHPQTQALGMLAPAVGTHPPLIGLPISFDEQRPGMRSVAPELGQHTAQLLPAGRPVEVPVR